MTGERTANGADPGGERPINETDRGIIAALAVNGRRSFREIARELKISEGTVRQRVGRMIDQNLIRITVVGNLITLGFEVVAFIQLRVKPGHADKVGELLTRYPHVRFVATSLGPADIVVQTLHHDVQSLHNFVNRDLPKAAPEITQIDCYQLSNVLKSTWTWGDWFTGSDMGEGVPEAGAV